MVTLHIHVPASETAASSFARQEDLYIRAEMISSYLSGNGALPRQVCADIFTGELPFVLLSPKGYRWEKNSPTYLYTLEAASYTQCNPEMLLWPLHMMEEKQVPVFVLPLPPGGGKRAGKLPRLYRNVEKMEHIIPSMLRSGPLVMVCSLRTFYEGLLLLIRDRSRVNSILPRQMKLVSLFGGDALSCSEEKIPDRKDLEEAMRSFSDTISIIALTGDRRIPASRILRSWMNDQGTIDASIDLVKPGFSAEQGIFSGGDETPECEGETGVPVLQKTKHHQLLRLEVSRMICTLLSAHTEIS